MKGILKQNKKLKDITSQVTEVAQYLWERGWAEHIAGNISVNINDLIVGELDDVTNFPISRLPDSYPNLANKYFLVTGTGRRMCDLARWPKKNLLIIKISEDGESYYIFTLNKKDVPELKPTSELATHLSIHNKIAHRGSKEKVIIHTHATELIALTHCQDIKSKQLINNIIWGMHPEVLMFIPKGIGFVPYTIPGSVDIASKTLKEFKDHDVVLWEKHGVFAIGENVIDTFNSIDIVSKSAKIWFMCKQAGFEPEGLTNEQLIELKKNYTLQKK
ncbi:MAG: rhamnulose-1-phosphate aldolase [Bacteroidetes bacterium]|nr:rhamnulose-1-phosphate aldolase [Bacteroidota bacterium]